MPRLVLLEDDGRELFSGDVSHANVRVVMGFLRRNVRAFQALAVVRAAWASAFGGPELPPAPPPRRRKAIATYTPPPRKSRR